MTHVLSLIGSADWHNLKYTHGNLKCMYSLTVVQACASEAPTALIKYFPVLHCMHDDAPLGAYHPGAHCLGQNYVSTQQ
jgi:hypothetical protein